LNINYSLHKTQEQQKYQPLIHTGQVSQKQNKIFTITSFTAIKSGRAREKVGGKGGGEMVRGVNITYGLRGGELLLLLLLLLLPLKGLQEKDFP
jgi:hypothetical protein